MKSKIIAATIAVAFLLAGLNVSFAQNKSSNKDVKQKTETVKQDVKKKTKEGIKEHNKVEKEKVVRTKEKVKHLKTHNVKSDKNKMKQTESETK